MAFDKVIDSAALNAGMTATANAIREKTGRAAPITWDSANGFKAAVEGIDTEGGLELPELGDTAAKPTDMAADKVLYDDQGIRLPVHLSRQMKFKKSFLLPAIILLVEPPAILYFTLAVCITAISTELL